MFLWKQQEIRTLSFFFGNLIRKFLKEKGYKFLIPVPPRPGKISEKGWDQIEELCKILECFYGIKVFRIAFGLPLGSELEYADELTLARALDGRQEM